MPIKIAIVEDNAEILEMLTNIIATDPGLQCVCTCSSGEMALRQIPEFAPGIVIMDLRLPQMSGIECTTQLKQMMPELQVLVYTVYGDNEQVFKALASGASGYLLKRSTAAEILEAIQDVSQGGAPMTGEIARKVVNSFRKPTTTVSPATAPAVNLTPREEGILNLLARGFVTGEIAQELGISFDTVRFHLRHIYAKLHVRSRTEAVLKFIK